MHHEFNARFHSIFARCTSHFFCVLSCAECNFYCDKSFSVSFYFAAPHTPPLHYFSFFTFFNLPFIVLFELHSLLRNMCMFMVNYFRFLIVDKKSNMLNKTLNHSHEWLHCSMCALFHVSLYTQAVFKQNKINFGRNYFHFLCVLCTLLKIFSPCLINNLNSGVDCLIKRKTFRKREAISYVCALCVPCL